MKSRTPQRTHGRNVRRVSPRAMRGSTAVEFALVFPLFFVIMYAIVTFSLIFVAQQNLTLAAEEGARAALNWQSSTSLQNALDNRGQAACTAATQMATAFVARAMTCTPTSAPCGNGMQCINVALSYNYSSNPFVPSLPIMNVALPATLQSNATVQLNPENVQ
ncbi:TadE/TadG family type IV pilus assembly protein [Paraburkholderia xenovorans]|uniref:TadE/TadG family type IV pilus assembly protein n=1 Tax=Paraburkholderia xenovorans TaxID=36873 RepID=UPI0038BDFBF0